VKGNSRGGRKQAQPCIARDAIGKPRVTSRDNYTQQFRVIAALRTWSASAYAP
jgi:hypothetical protein